MQVLPSKNNESTIYAVLPVDAANANMVMPAKNVYKPDCQPGTYVGPDDFDPCPPCAKGEFSTKVNSAHCDDCAIGFWSSVEGKDSCFECPYGTITYGLGATGLGECHCKSGFYHKEGKSGMECLECPDGAICDGGLSLPVPERGYWMDKKECGMAHQCDPPSICPGGAAEQCGAGYTGRLCAECSPGYYNVISTCFKCPPKSVVVVLIVLVFIGWYIINVVVSKNVASLEMVLTWAQLANVIGDVELQWPGKLHLMFGVANLLDFDVDILEPSCLTPWSFKHNHIVQLLLPFLMSLMAYLGYLSSYVAHKFKYKVSRMNLLRLQNWMGWFITIPQNDEELSEKWDATIAAFLSSIEVTYITVAKYCFDVFKCENIGGVSVLRTAPSIECHTHEHTALIVLGVVGTLVYSIGYLAFVSWKIRQLYITRSFQHSKNLRRYGFLYCHFELDYCWTTIVVLARRLLFILVLVFVNNPGFQAGSLAIIITASLMLHVYTTPFVDTYLDVLFSSLLVVLMLESFSGVLFYGTNLPSDGKKVLEYIVLIFVLCVIAMSVYSIAFEMKRKFEGHSVRTMHYKDVLTRKYQMSSSLPIIFPAVSPEARAVKKEISDELVQALDSSFVYKALKKHPEHLKDWDKLNHMTKDIMCDRSVCSYLSRDSVAKFWRKLVDRFPELVDFLAVADGESREHFNHFATTLYQDFYLANKVKRLPIVSILNWRDRGSMAQWLAVANQSDRKFFIQFMSNLFKAVRGDKEGSVVGEEGDDSNDQAGNGCPHTCISIRELGGPPSTKSLWSKVKRSSKDFFLAERSNGRNPFEIELPPAPKATDGLPKMVLLVGKAFRKKRLAPVPESGDGEESSESVNKTS